MNQSIQTIMSRRTCRNFTQERVMDEQLELIVQAGLSAPSARNAQTWKFFVIQNKEQQTALARVMGIALGQAEYGFYGADTLILVSNDIENHNASADCACAMENMMLAAHALELGSVWINQMKQVCKDQGVRNWLSELGVPSHQKVYAICAVGHPDQVPYREKVIKGSVVFIR
ncbi:MAG: nitroreductase family protein [Erysipelotrichaceae bacterium]